MDIFPLVFGSDIGEHAAMLHVRRSLCNEEACREPLRWDAQPSARMR
jgi:hypothetical protein